MKGQRSQVKGFVLCGFAKHEQHVKPIERSQSTAISTRPTTTTAYASGSRANAYLEGLKGLPAPPKRIIGLQVLERPAIFHK